MNTDSDNQLNAPQKVGQIFPIGPRDLARIFITGYPNWDFKNLGCPKSLIEKVKIITLIMYINKSSNYMLNSSRNVFVIILKSNFS